MAKHLRLFVVAPAAAISAPSTATQASSDDQQPPSVTLYQYAICPFCSINKALLSYNNTPYEKVEVNPLTKAELKLWSKDYFTTIISIAIINDDQYNGLSDINHVILEQRLVKDQLNLKWATTEGNALLTSLLLSLTFLFLYTCIYVDTWYKSEKKHN